MYNIEELTAKVLTYCIKRKTTIREAVGKIVPSEFRPIVKALAVNVAKNYIRLDKLIEHVLKINVNDLDEFNKNLLRTIIYEIRYRGIRVREKYLTKFRISKREISIIRDVDIGDLVKNLTLIKQLEIRYSVPEFIIKRLIAYTQDMEDLENLLEYFQKEPIKYVRVAKGCSVINVMKNLEAKGVKCRVDEHFKDLIVIEESKVNVAKLVEYEKGIIHPQDKASLAISIELLNEALRRDAILIDTTAGPGNKISYVAERGVYSIGIEISRRRVYEIDRNVKRLNIVNIDYLQADSRKIPLKLDRDIIVLVDPDCTSIGRLHINPEIKLWLTEKDIIDRAQKQYELLSSIIQLTPKKCTIYYCTCTLTYEENEKNIIQILQKYDIDIEEISILIAEESKILKRTYIIPPHKYKCTGMFITKIVK